MKIGLFYGSETGNTKEHASTIHTLLSGTNLELTDDPVDVASFDVEDLLNYDVIIFGSPTWNIGELQSDIGEVFDDFDNVDLTNKKIAIYGCGDQEGYPDSYQDAIGILARKLRDNNATIVGYTSTEGHSFEESLGIENDKFMGLALDDDNQPDLSEKRIKEWIDQLLKESKEW